MRLIAAQEGGIPIGIPPDTPVTVNVAQCQLCNHLCKLLTQKLRRGDGMVFMCERCDLAFLAGGTSTDYDGPYRARATPNCTTPEQIFLTYKDYQEDRLRIVRPHLKDSILEYGASAGQFLWHLNIPRLCAIEPDSACQEFMATLGIDHPGIVETFDTVCAFQLLEHCADPVKFIRGMLQHAKPGAKLFIEVPNLHDPLRSVWHSAAYEDFYFHSDHLWYFSEKSLRMVAEKAGAQNIEIMHTQDYNLLNHLHWLTEGKPQETCHPGLSPISLPGTHPIARWLSNSLATLNEVYKAKLAAAGKTSNLMMVISA